MQSSAVDPSRRARLNAVKLAALVRDHTGLDHTGLDLTPAEFAGGAAARAGDTGWVLLDHTMGRTAGLGSALAWAHRAGVTSLHVVADEGTGPLARQAEGFSVPISVWQVQGRDLVPAVVEPLRPSADAPAHHDAFRADIEAAGADPVVEHGVLAGEIEGLEMCRVVDDAFTGETRLEVGVGAHDREAFHMLHGNRPSVTPMATVAAAVRQHRQPLDPSHPLGRLALERALRAQLVREPSLVGASLVVPVAPPTPRRNLKDATPCAAVATVEGRSVAVVCSVGIDLEVMPFAVDTCASLKLDHAIVVLPTRDAIALQRQLADSAIVHLSVVPVDLQA